MNTPDARPWYQQFWVWFVIAIPALAVTFSLQFVYIAFTHQDPVVRGDWYQDGKSVNQSFIRSDRASALGLRADIRFDEVTGEVLPTASLPQWQQMPAIPAPATTADCPTRPAGWRESMRPWCSAASACSAARAARRWRKTLSPAGWKAITANATGAAGPPAHRCRPSCWRASTTLPRSRSSCVARDATPVPN
ncbi:hypothetical protein C5O18_02820 [Amnimonas aquatica]|uniref:Nitrogen fixation protein FixH n=1 Tax=Amnimonas aquatica TaxID=2094561 RepID=A0A2P6AU73_9GAMM|nr:hypothetical protein C5O18_02820 [Amnimonas aquatica]